MALIKCKECGNEVSSKAEACPKCGVRIAAKPMGCGTVIGVIVLGIIIISTFSGVFSPRNESDSSSRATAPQPTTSAPPAPKVPGEQWAYRQTDDPMGKGTTHYARVTSTNTVNFGFPYSGAQHGTLTLRAHPRFGTDIIFSIKRGQILCRSYQDCTVLIRFDDEPAINFSAVGAADNSTETIFIRNYNGFMEKLRKAKRVRIAAEIYQQGAPVFEFDISSFDPNKYRPR